MIWLGAATTFHVHIAYIATFGLFLILLSLSMELNIPIQRLGFGLGGLKGGRQMQKN